MRYINIVLTMLSIALSACTSVQTRPANPSQSDCLARLDCRLVEIDNTNNQYDVDFRLNNIKLGNVDSYGTASFPFYTSQLVHGNCGTVTARLVNTGQTMSSTEECIRQGEYFKVTITSRPRQIWLTPFISR